MKAGAASVECGARTLLQEERSQKKRERICRRCGPRLEKLQGTRCGEERAAHSGWRAGELFLRWKNCETICMLNRKGLNM